ncbi:RNA-directed DNA polymerase from mobile element jockey [Plakobranchus ocellatus]|uniref:RNA-directed DNA polymerase from mobile element jockey n=1 Tax=Plakobranchus ocellatus TaxID=259542 RepID=A0AAV3YQG1_9GAST|nr:RNA-directed DNA polymerase from mobile element jockey [Plakobranchus ocellatus]
MNNIGNAIRTLTKLSYAEDMVLWQQDTNINKPTVAINRDLASLKRFCERWKMQIKTGKTAYTTFLLSKPMLKKDPDIHIGNDSLRRDDLPRYLGVSLDPRLCFRRHIEGEAKSVRERTKILQKLARTNSSTSFSSSSSSSFSSSSASTLSATSSSSSPSSCALSETNVDDNVPPFKVILC